MTPGIEGVIEMDKSKEQLQEEVELLEDGWRDLKKENDRLRAEVIELKGEIKGVCSTRDLFKVHVEELRAECDKKFSEEVIRLAFHTFLHSGVPEICMDPQDCMLSWEEEMKIYLLKEREGDQGSMTFPCNDEKHEEEREMPGLCPNCEMPGLWDNCVDDIDRWDGYYCATCDTWFRRSEVE